MRHLNVKLKQLDLGKQCEAERGQLKAWTTDNIMKPENGRNKLEGEKHCIQWRDSRGWPSASCGYASAMSGYIAGQGRFATLPLASVSWWLDRLASAWVAGPWVRHTKATCPMSFNP
jgi:hypothetical protein